MSSVFIMQHSYPPLHYLDYLPYRNRHVVETKCVALVQDILSMRDQEWGPLLVAECPP
jgi:hypothetical protein